MPSQSPRVSFLAGSAPLYRHLERIARRNRRAAAIAVATATSASVTEEALAAARREKQTQQSDASSTTGSLAHDSNPLDGRSFDDQVLKSAFPTPTNLQSDFGAENSELTATLEFRSSERALLEGVPVLDRRNVKDVGKPLGATFELKREELDTLGLGTDRTVRKFLADARDDEHGPGEEHPIVIERAILESISKSGFESVLHRHKLPLPRNAERVIFSDRVTLRVPNGSLLLEASLPREHVKTAQGDDALAVKLPFRPHLVALRQGHLTASQRSNSLHCFNGPEIEAPAVPPRRTPVSASSPISNTVLSHGAQITSPFPTSPTEEMKSPGRLHLESTVSSSSMDRPVAEPPPRPNRPVPLRSGPSTVLAQPPVRATPTVEAFTTSEPSLTFEASASAMQAISHAYTDSGNSQARQSPQAPPVPPRPPPRPPKPAAAVSGKPLRTSNFPSPTEHDSTSPHTPSPGTSTGYANPAQLARERALELTRLLESKYPSESQLLDLLPKRSFPPSERRWLMRADEAAGSIYAAVAQLAPVVASLELSERIRTRERRARRRMLQMHAAVDAAASPGTANQTSQSSPQGTPVQESATDDPSDFTSGTDELSDTSSQDSRGKVYSPKRVPTVTSVRQTQGAEQIISLDRESNASSTEGSRGSMSAYPSSGSEVEDSIDPGSLSNVPKQSRGNQILQNGVPEVSSDQVYHTAEASGGSTGSQQSSTLALISSKILSSRAAVLASLRRFARHKHSEDSNKQKKSSQIPSTSQALLAEASGSEQEANWERMRLTPSLTLLAQAIGTAAVDGGSSPIEATLVITNLGLYIFPPAITVDNQTFLVYHSYRAIPLSSICALRVPFASGVSSSENEFAMRTEFLGVHFLAPRARERLGSFAHVSSIGEESQHPSSTAVAVQADASALSAEEVAQGLAVPTGILAKALTTSTVPIPPIDFHCPLPQSLRDPGELVPRSSSKSSSNSSEMPRSLSTNGEVAPLSTPSDATVRVDGGVEGDDLVSTSESETESEVGTSVHSIPTSTSEMSTDSSPVAQGSWSQPAGEFSPSQATRDLGTPSATLGIVCSPGARGSEEDALAPPPVLTPQTSASPCIDLHNEDDDDDDDDDEGDTDAVLPKPLQVHLQLSEQLSNTYGAAVSLGQRRVSSSKRRGKDVGAATLPKPKVDAKVKRDESNRATIALTLGPRPPTVSVPFCVADYVSTSIEQEVHDAAVSGELSSSLWCASEPNPGLTPQIASTVVLTAFGETLRACGSALVQAESRQEAVDQVTPFSQSVGCNYAASASGRSVPEDGHERAQGPPSNVESVSGTQDPDKLVGMQVKQLPTSPTPSSYVASPVGEIATKSRPAQLELDRYRLREKLLVQDQELSFCTLVIETRPGRRSALFEALNAVVSAAQQAPVDVAHVDFSTFLCQTLAHAAFPQVAQAKRAFWNSLAVSQPQANISQKQSHECAGLPYPPRGWLLASSSPLPTPPRTYLSFAPFGFTMSMCGFLPNDIASTFDTDISNDASFLALLDDIVPQPTVHPKPERRHAVSVSLSRPPASKIASESVSHHDDWENDENEELTDHHRGHQHQNRYLRHSLGYTVAPKETKLSHLKLRWLTRALSLRTAAPPLSLRPLLPSLQKLISMSAKLLEFPESAAARANRCELSTQALADVVFGLLKSTAMTSHYTCPGNPYNPYNPFAPDFPKRIQAALSAFSNSQPSGIINLEGGSSKFGSDFNNAMVTYLGLQLPPLTSPLEPQVVDRYVAYLARTLALLAYAPHTLTPFVPSAPAPSAGSGSTPADISALGRGRAQSLSASSHDTRLSGLAISPPHQTLRMLTAASSLTAAQTLDVCLYLFHCTLAAAFFQEDVEAREKENKPSGSGGGGGPSVAGSVRSNTSNAGSIRGSTENPDRTSTPSTTGGLGEGGTWDEHHNPNPADKQRVRRLSEGTKQAPSNSIVAEGLGEHVSLATESKAMSPLVSSDVSTITPTSRNGRTGKQQYHTLNAESLRLFRDRASDYQSEAFQHDFATESTNPGIPAPPNESGSSFDALSEPGKSERTDPHRSAEEHVSIGGDPSAPCGPAHGSEHVSNGGSAPGSAPKSIKSSADLRLSQCCDASDAVSELSGSSSGPFDDYSTLSEGEDVDFSMSSYRKVHGTSDLLPCPIHGSQRSQRRSAMSASRDDLDDIQGPPSVLDLDSDTVIPGTNANEICTCFHRTNIEVLDLEYSSKLRPATRSTRRRLMRERYSLQSFLRSEQSAFDSLNHASPQSSPPSGPCLYRCYVEKVGPVQVESTPQIGANGPAAQSRATAANPITRGQDESQLITRTATPDSFIAPGSNANSVVAGTSPGVQNRTVNQHGQPQKPISIQRSPTSSCLTSTGYFALASSGQCLVQLPSDVHAAALTSKDLAATTVPLVSPYALRDLSKSFTLPILPCFSQPLPIPPTFLNFLSSVLDPIRHASTVPGSPLAPNSPSRLLPGLRPLVHLVSSLIKSHRALQQVLSKAFIILEPSLTAVNPPSYASITHFEVPPPPPSSFVAQTQPIGRANQEEDALGQLQRSKSTNANSVISEEAGSAREDESATRISSQRLARSLSDSATPNPPPQAPVEQGPTVRLRIKYKEDDGQSALPDAEAKLCEDVPDAVLHLGCVIEEQGKPGLSTITAKHLTASATGPLAEVLSIHGLTMYQVEPPSRPARPPRLRGAAMDVPNPITNTAMSANSHALGAESQSTATESGYVGVGRGGAAASSTRGANQATAMAAAPRVFTLQTVSQDGLLQATVQPLPEDMSFHERQVLLWRSALVSPTLL